MNALAIPTDGEIEQLANGHDRSDLAEKDLDTLASEARYHKEQAEHHHQRMLWHYIEMGRRLLEAKRRPGMGVPELTVWATQEVGVRQAEAYNLMRLARPENLQRVVNLPPETSVRHALEVIHEQKREERAEVARNTPRPYREVPLPETCDVEVGDAAALPLPDDLVDLIVTSPPYGLGVNYADTDDAQGYLTYLEHANAWAEEMYRVAAPQGRICLNVPLDVTRNDQQAMYADWVYCLKSGGWTYETTVIWNEDNVNKTTARGSVDSPNAPHIMAYVETIIVMRKGEWNLHRIGSHDLEHDEWLEWTNGTWTFPGAAPISKDHCPKPFPEELPRRCLKLFSFRGDTVLDPFCGSGTTGVVAATMGRRFYGFDHSAKYVEQARERIADAIRRAA